MPNAQEKKPWLVIVHTFYCFFFPLIFTQFTKWQFIILDEILEREKCCKTFSFIC